MTTLRPTKNKDLVLNIPFVMQAMSGVAQVRQNTTKRVFLIYTDGTTESAPHNEYLSEDMNLFELVRNVQAFARQE